MSERIKAIFERGVFRPVEPVSIPDGTAATVEFDKAPEGLDKALLDAAVVDAVLREIDLLPAEGNPGETDISVNHGQYLYGEKARHP